MREPIECDVCFVIYQPRQYGATCPLKHNISDTMWAMVERFTKGSVENVIFKALATLADNELETVSRIDVEVSMDTFTLEEDGYPRFKKKMKIEIIH